MAKLPSKTPRVPGGRRMTPDLNAGLAGQARRLERELRKKPAGEQSSEQRLVDILEALRRAREKEPRK